MSNKLNKLRKGCKDVFNAFLVELACYAGIFEFPVIKPTYDISNKLVAFSKCISSNNYDAWVHFYEDDYLFERLWRSPKKYLEVLKRYNGVILPDYIFSTYKEQGIKVYQFDSSFATSHKEVV